MFDQDAEFTVTVPSVYVEADCNNPVAHVTQIAGLLANHVAHLLSHKAQILTNFESKVEDLASFIFIFESLSRNVLMVAEGHDAESPIHFFVL